MIAMTVPAPAISLEDRLSKGAEWLFDMEQRGDVGDEYHRWLVAWLQLLAQYERAEAT